MYRLFYDDWEENHIPVKDQKNSSYCEECGSIKEIVYDEFEHQFLPECMNCGGQHMIPPSLKVVQVVCFNDYV